MLWIRHVVCFNCYVPICLPTDVHNYIKSCALDLSKQLLSNHFSKNGQVNIPTQCGWFPACLTWMFDHHGTDRPQRGTVLCHAGIQVLRFELLGWDQCDRLPTLGWMQKSVPHHVSPGPTRWPVKIQWYDLSTIESLVESCWQWFYQRFVGSYSVGGSASRRNHQVTLLSGIWSVGWSWQFESWGLPPKMRKYNQLKPAKTSNCIG